MTTSADDDARGLVVFVVRVPSSCGRRPWTVHEPYEMYQKYPGVFVVPSWTVRASSLARSPRDVHFVSFMYTICHTYETPSHSYKLLFCTNP